MARFSKTKAKRCPVARLRERLRAEGTKFSRVYRSHRKDDILQLIEDAIEEQVDKQGYSKIVVEPAQLEAHLNNAHVTDDIGQTALHLAMMWCQGSVVKRLLEAGLHPDQPDSAGMCPVHCGALLGYPEVLQLLPPELLQLPQQDSGKCALHFAAMAGNVAVVKFIVEAGGDVNTKDKYGQTPIFIAALYTQPDCIELLLDYGARTDVKDISGVPVVMIVNANYQSLAFTMLDKYVEKEDYNELYKVDLSFMLSNLKEEIEEDSAQDRSCTVYEGMVAVDKNVTSHITVRCLTDIKWKKYGRRIFYSRFLVFLVFNLYWTLLYGFPTDQVSADFSGRNTVAYSVILLNVVMVAFSGGSLSYNIVVNRRVVSKLMRLAGNRFSFERDTQNHLTAPYFVAYKQFYKSRPTALKTWGGEAGNVILFVMHVSLLMQGVLKPLHFIEKSDTTTFTPVALSLLNAVVLIGLWTRLFYECKVHTVIGRFVIYTREVITDVGLVFSIFAFMYIPNLAIFYYTVYRFDTSNETTWYDIPFNLLRMSVVDYDYDEGKELTKSRSIDWWWNVYSIMWIFVSAIIVVNLFIALMSDRYATLGSRAKNITAQVRAEFIANIDNIMPAKSVDALNQQIYDEAVISHYEEADEHESTQIERLEEKIDSLVELLEKRSQHQ